MGALGFSLELRDEGVRFLNFGEYLFDVLGCGHLVLGLLCPEVRLLLLVLALVVVVSVVPALH